MKRDNLEQYFDRSVTIRLFNDKEYTGYLRKTHDERFRNDPNLYLPNKLYFLSSGKDKLDCMSCLFRSSHVTKLLCNDFERAPGKKEMDTNRDISKNPILEDMEEER